VLLGGLAVTATNWESILLLKRDKELSAEASADSAALRPILANVAWNMWQDSPLIGHGYGQYIEARRPYLADRSSELPLEKVKPYIQHNVLLALLVDTGVVGASLLLLVFGCWTRDGWKLWTSRDAPLVVRQHGLLVLMMIAAYAVNGMFHDVSIMAMIHMLLFFMAGLSSGLLAECSEAAASSPDQPRVWQWPPKSAVAR
jgi:O-antigen ligase